MKTLSEIKNELAKEIGYKSWPDYINELKGNFHEGNRLEIAWEGICKRYAVEAIKEVIEITACHADEGCFDKEGALVNSLNILK